VVISSGSSRGSSLKEPAQWKGGGSGNDVKEEEVKELKARIELLECENRAMKKVVEVQEEAMGSEQTLTRWREEVFKLLVQVRRFLLEKAMMIVFFLYSQFLTSVGVPG